MCVRPICLEEERNLLSIALIADRTKLQDTHCKLLWGEVTLIGPGIKHLALKLQLRAVVDRNRQLWSAKIPAGWPEMARRLEYGMIGRC
jgi:hypothetical protein